MDFGGDTDVPIVCQCNLHACESLRDQRVKKDERERERKDQREGWKDEVSLMPVMTTVKGTTNNTTHDSLKR